MCMGLVAIFTLGIPRIYQIDDLLSTETELAHLIGLHQFFDQSAAHLHYDLHFLGNKATKNLVFMGFYRKYERLKNASNPVIISI